MKQIVVVKIQEAYNKEHHIIPQTIHKEIHDLIQGKETMEEASSLLQKVKSTSKSKEETDCRSRKRK